MQRACRIRSQEFMDQANAFCREVLLDTSAFAKECMKIVVTVGNNQEKIDLEQFVQSCYNDIFCKAKTLPCRQSKTRRPQTLWLPPRTTRWKTFALNPVPNPPTLKSFARTKTKQQRSAKWSTLHAKETNPKTARSASVLPAPLKPRVT